MSITVMTMVSATISYDVLYSTRVKCTTNFFHSSFLHLSLIIRKQTSLIRLSRMMKVNLSQTSLIRLSRMMKVNLSRHINDHRTLQDNRKTLMRTLQVENCRLIQARPLQ